jgi:hypothetical protein
MQVAAYLRVSTVKQSPQPAGRIGRLPRTRLTLATRPATRPNPTQIFQRLHRTSIACTERPSHYAGRSTVAQILQHPHRSLISLRSAFLVLRGAFKARTERSTLAQRVQHSHSAFIGLRNPFNARTTRSSLARKAKSRPRRFPVTFSGIFGHYPCGQSRPFTPKRR